jgi:hypothetical protein
MATLPFVKDGTEAVCIPCKNYIGSTWLCQKQKPQELRMHLRIPENWSIFFAGVQRWEVAFLKSGGVRVMGKELGDLCFSSVDAVSESMLKFEKALGIFWPLPLHEARWGKVAKRKVTHMDEDDGTRTVGVILDEKWGTPIGTTRVTKMWGNRVESRQRLADSRSDLRKGQQLDAFAHARELAIGDVITKPDLDADDDEQPALASVSNKGGSKRKVVDSESDDDVQYFSGFHLCGGRAGAGRSTPTKPKIVAEGDGEPPSAKRRKPGPSSGGTSMKQWNAIVEREALLQSCSNMLTLAQNDAGLLSLIPAQVSSKIGAIKKQLSDSARTLLLMSADETFKLQLELGEVTGAELTEKGARLVASLEDILTSMDAVLALVTCLAGSKNKSNGAPERSRPLIRWSMEAQRLWWMPGKEFVRPGCELRFAWTRKSLRGRRMQLTRTRTTPSLRHC